MAVASTGGTVFISYARADASDLAARLHADLASHGVRAWHDTSAIDGGASWTEEIERAIDECRSVVALSSDGSFRSHVCRAEQRRDPPTERRDGSVSRHSKQSERSHPLTAIRRHIQ